MPREDVWKLDNVTIARHPMEGEGNMKGLITVTVEGPGGYGTATLYPQDAKQLIADLKEAARIDPWDG